LREREEENGSGKKNPSEIQETSTINANLSVADVVPREGVPKTTI